MNSIQFFEDEQEQVLLDRSGFLQVLNRLKNQTMQIKEFRKNLYRFHRIFQIIESYNQKALKEERWICGFNHVLYKYRARLSHLRLLGLIRRPSEEQLQS